MFEFLQRLLSKENGSRKVAKERLQLVLIHDRGGISPQLLETLKEDLIGVLSKYMDIDREGLEVTFNNHGSAVAFVANIPVLQVKRSLDS